MMESSDSSSESCDPSEEGRCRNNDELPVAANVVIEDLTGETDDLVGENESFVAFNLSSGVPAIKPRSYQLEMFEESLKQNIIVAMDTGSGKTHIAMLRILYELEHSLPHQLIWFLAPTVSLCQQQYDYMRSQITSVQLKFISSADNVERWTNQTHWDEVLKNVRIVVSPYQILLEALSHGFLRIEQLAMIVFDEAHNCVGKHPGSKLMQNFYHRQKSQGLQVPKVLGLTASPVMRSNLLSVSKIEQTLDAICRTPKKHQTELRLHAKLPALIHVQYDTLFIEYTQTVNSLSQAFKSMDLTKDPYYLSLVKDNTERAQKALQKLILNHKTASHVQIKHFYIVARRINQELGDWAADYYVSQIVSKVMQLVNDTDCQAGTWDVLTAEKQYIAQVLQQVKLSGDICNRWCSSSSVSNKVTKLIEVLATESGHSSGIIFVKERATASVLANLLRVHPRTTGKFKVGTVVGTSQHLKRTGNIGDFLDDSDSALANFRSGKLNLVTATSVLEEGLDVPECNLVICFEKPANLKSFVQRRGRARHQDSKLVLLLDSRDKNLHEWQQLEADMKAMYEDEIRMLQEMAHQEDVEEYDGRAFRIESTNATLDLDSAVAHLHHFCSVLPSRDYVDLRPDFICSQENNLIRARVILPISVHEEVRVSESKSAWINEKNAIKDAAFQAYVALYHAGLVNDNLLPLLKRDEVVDELMTSAVETRASLMMVNEQLNPWISIAQAWKSGIQPKQCAITLGNLELQMYLPVEIPNIPSFSLYWDSKTNIIVTQTQQSVSADLARLATASNETWAILQASFGGRFPVEKKQVVVQFSVNHNLPPLPSLLGQKHASAQGLSEASGLIRDKMTRNVPYLFQELLQTKPHIRDVQQPYLDYELIPENTPHISVKPLPKKVDFLRKINVQNQSESSKSYRIVLPLSRCTEDNMPFRFVQFGMLMPHITRRYELYLIAQHLSNTLLKDVHISDASVIVTAICASSANEETNYQRLEFLGDSILKMCTSVQLLATYPLWHEGYLSFKKDRLVANSRLARAAVDLGLDSFIITKAFTGHKWRPLFVENLLEATNEGKRQVSSKVLADVVEALIGASMTDGGLPKALSCLQIFLPELDWQQLSDRRDFIYHRIPNAELPSTLEPLEDLIGYKFTKKALLTEAMTHASCNTGSASLERLEFLGDSILDYIIVTTMYQHKLSHVQMHLLRTALVNADFLAFICMEWSTSQEVVELITSNDTSVPIFKEAKNLEVPLWRFMRHSSPQLGFLQVATMRRHAELREDIRNAIEYGSHYPWALLARLQAHKFYSDLIESLLGALWIDSGSFDICREAVERMGILGYLKRILREGVHVWHPKEELGLVADVERVRYVLEVEKRVDKGDGGGNGVGNEYKCTVFVGEREIVSVSGGLSKEEVKAKAAELAVATMKAGKEKGVDKGSMKTAGMYVDLGDDLTMSGC